MIIEQSGIEDLVIVIPSIFNDDRGYFFESYNKKTLNNEGIDIDFVQDNQSFSKKGTLRGLHYQNPSFAQIKLIRVLQGEIMDVAVDLRKKSATYGKSFAIVLSCENKKQLLIPHGFAHGFSVLSETAVVSYKVDQYLSLIHI
jgi:dTDP-4-dehydrorhamnose 3,5-epimerase